MKRVRVGDVLEFQRRQVNISPKLLYTLIGIYSFGRGIFHRSPQLGVDLGDYKFSSILPNDLVLSNLKAWEGAIAIAAENDLGTIGTNRFLCYVARNPLEISTNWARYFFLSPIGLPLIKKASPGSVHRNNTISRERFEAIEIPLPDIREQHEIALCLDRITSICSNIEQRRHVIIKRIEALQGSLAGQPHLTDNDRKNAGWRYLPLSEILSESNDSVEVKFGKQYPNLGIYSFGRGLFDKPPINGMESSAKKLYRVRSGQFIYSRLFAFEGAYAFVPDKFDGYFVSNEFPTFNVDPDVAEAEFVAAALRSPQQWRVLADSSKGLGVRRQRVHVDALLSHKLWIPPVSEQSRIVKGLRKSDRAHELIKESNARVGAVVQSALNQAFAGLE